MAANTPVQEKIHCVYITGVTNELSSKRPQQNFKVSATSNLTEKALSDDIANARATEKLDGTCCLIDTFKGQPWLWARHDRKPSKSGDKRFTQYKKLVVKNKEEAKEPPEPFNWTPKDLKEVPERWIPASRLEIKDGFVMPDSIGHTPGWVPVELNSRQHCWHLSAVDLNQGIALILREDDESHESLLICVQPLSNLCGKTCELVGTNINANPYGFGNKKLPLHLLVPHGSLGLHSTTSPTSPHTDPTDYDGLLSWFSSSASSAQVEGVVWHTKNQQLHKLHRHHLNLKWPVESPYLSQRQVKVQLDLSLIEGREVVLAKGQQDMFSLLAEVNGQSFDDIHELCKVLGCNKDEGS